MEGTAGSGVRRRGRSGLWVKQLALSFNVGSALPARKGHSTPAEEKVLSCRGHWGTTYLEYFVLAAFWTNEQGPPHPFIFYRKSHDSHPEFTPDVFEAHLLSGPADSFGSSQRVCQKVCDQTPTESFRTV